MATKILLVDDNNKVRASLKVELEGLGYEVVEATHGLSGLVKAKEQHFDGFVVDHKMPIMDGITLVRDLRELSQYVSHPIVLMTTGSCSMLSKSIDAHCMEKPVDLEVLREYLTQPVKEQVA